jgi:hypothetical protein
MAVQSPLRKVFRSVFSNTFNLTVNFLSRIGGGSVVTYLSRLLTSSTTTPFYAGTTNIVDSSATGDYREIQPGRCLDFDGSTQYVFYDDAIGVSGSDDRTITFWGRAVDGCGITMGGTGTGEKLSLVQTSAVLRIEVQGGGFTSSLPFPDDEWVFISATFSGTTLAGFRLGVNGVF